MRLIQCYGLFLFLFCFSCALFAQKAKDPVKGKEEEKIIPASISIFDTNKKDTKENLKLKKLLETKKLGGDFKQTPLADILKLIRKQGVRVIVPTKEIQALVRGSNITMELENMRLKDAIELLFGHDGLGCEIKNGALVVKDSNKPEDPRVYSIADLVEKGDDDKYSAFLPEQITDLIQQLPLPNGETWDGETHSVSTDDQGNLIINTRQKVHDTITKLLNGLRKQARLQKFRIKHGSYLLSQANLKVQKLLLDKKVAFDFEEDNYKEALDLLREEGLSIVADKASTKKMISKATISMELKKTYLLDALEMIAGFQGLGFKLKGGIIILYQKKEDTTALKNSVMELKKELDAIKATLVEQRKLLKELKK